jgi:N-acetylmuramoyl-L-alanine amidase
VRAAPLPASRRRVSRSGRAALAAALGLALLGVARPPGLGDIVAVRSWSYPEYTRVVIELSRPVATEVRRLPADRSAGRPERLYLDLEGVWVGRMPAEGIPIGDGLLRDVRLGQNTLRRTRVVIDLERYESHRLITLGHPDRVVIDVYGPRGATGRPDVAPEGRLRLPAALRPVRTVVIDRSRGAASASSSPARTTARSASRSARRSPSPSPATSSSPSTPTRPPAVRSTASRPTI